MSGWQSLGEIARKIVREAEKKREGQDAGK